MASNSKLTADSVAHLENGGTLVIMEPKPPAHNGEGTPPLKTHLPKEVSDRQRRMLQVLSRKAFERTQMLNRGSRELIDTSRKLVSESKRRREKALHRLELRAA